MKRILVIGATGNVGRQVASQLLATNVGVRALTRNPDTADLPSEVEVVRGDLAIPETLYECLEDVDAIFLVWTAPAATAPVVINRLARHVPRIVFLSAPHQTPHPLFQQPNPLAAMHAGIEETIKDTGVSWTFLRPGMFSANALSWWAPQIRAGAVVRWPYADVPTAPIHERDIAAVAVRALLERGHDRGDYVLTGPAALNHREQIATIGEVIGKPLRLEEISPEEARRELLTIMPAPAIEMLLKAWAAALGHPALVTSTVSDITGTPARTYRDWVTDHLAEFRD
jgi:uncharacterized protein YbjT (DUF2867 family)